MRFLRWYSRFSANNNNDLGVTNFCLPNPQCYVEGNVCPILFNVSVLKCSSYWMVINILWPQKLKLRRQNYASKPGREQTDLFLFCKLLEFFPVLVLNKRGTIKEIIHEYSFIDIHVKLDVSCIWSVFCGMPHARIVICITIWSQFIKTLSRTLSIWCNIWFQILPAGYFCTRKRLANKLLVESHAPLHRNRRCAPVGLKIFKRL